MSKLKYYDGITWKTVNGQVTGDTLPIGAIFPYGNSTAPAGWLVCDGSYVSKTEYSELYSVIGDEFLNGGTAPSGKFRLPDLKGRVPVGQDTNDTDFDTIGETGGEKTHTLTVNEMPSHNHKVYRSGSTSAGYGSLFQNTSSTTELTANVMESTGGGQAHNNLQPYQTVNYIIKAKQSAGLVANVSNTQSQSTTDTYSCNYINGIIESGANANGTYTKFADGTLICKNYFGPITTNGGSGLDTTVNLPTSFLNNEYTIVATILDGQAYWADISYSAGFKTTNSFVFSTWNNGGAANLNQWFNYIAIGRWK